MKGRLMNTNQLAEVLEVDPRFVRRSLHEAAKAEFLEVTQELGKGRLKFTDPALFAAWLRKRGFLDAARKLEAYDTGTI